MEIVGNRDLIRVAVARVPSQAIPLFGTYWGDREDELGMKVEVNVKTASALLYLLLNGVPGTQTPPARWSFARVCAHECNVSTSSFQAIFLKFLAGFSNHAHF